MKKGVTMNNKNLIIAICIVILSGILFSLAFVIKPKAVKYDTSKYPKGTKVNTSKKLQKEHCVDNICVSNVYIYYVDDRGEIKYTVENKSSSSKKGYLKMNFNGNEIYLNYDFSQNGNKYENIASYTGTDIGKVKNYTLKKLTKKEEKSIIS